MTQTKVEQIDQEMENSLSCLEDDLFQLEQKVDDLHLWVKLPPKVTNGILASLAFLRKNYHHINEYLNEELCQLHNQLSDVVQPLEKVAQTRKKSLSECKIAE